MRKTEMRTTLKSIIPFTLLLSLPLLLDGCTDSQNSEECSQHEPSVVELTIVEEELVESDTVNIPQDNYEFKKFVDPRKVGKKWVDVTEDSTIYETTYLGKIKVGSEYFHVLSQFYSVQAAIERHGHSRILFLENDGKLKKEYVLDLPEELPTGIKNNRLRLGKELFDEMKDELPELICIPNGGCY